MAEIEVYFRKIRFNDLDLVLRLFKKEGRSLADVLSFFENAGIRDYITKSYTSLPPIQIQEVLHFANAEQRMIGMSIIPPEEMLTQLAATMLDRQTVHKKQIRWDAQWQPYTFEYEDTYILYSISGEKFNVLGNRFSSHQIPAVYLVQCRCISTRRTYFHYVPEWIGINRDAVAAIAWTYKFNDYHLSKAQYLQLIHSET